MALDPGLECLPEHEGPAFNTWQLIMQTTMGKVVHTPSPSGFHFQRSRQIYKKDQPFIAGEDFIALETNQQSSSKKNSSVALKRKKSVSSSDSLSSSEPEEDEELSCQSKVAPWKKQKYPANAAGLHLEIKDFYEYISPLPEEETMRHDVVSRITNLITSIWPSAKVEVFGSFRTNLYLPTSDIDLAVFGNWDALPLFTLEKALISKEFAEPSTIKVLDKATVPIIKLTDKKSKIRVDISFNVETSVKSADMVKSYIKEFKILPYLFLTLKHFLVQRDLNEVFTGGIGSYCLMLLTISFLQRHPRVDVKKEENVNLGVLLMEFFELYGRNFNYQKIGIKVKNGGRYISKDEVAKELSDGEYPALLCIEDPVTLACDIGRSSFGILRVKEAFEYAFNTLDKAIRNRNYFKINPGSTYLSRIISIPPDLRAYRKSIKKLYTNEICAGTSARFDNTPNAFGENTFVQNSRPPLLPTPQTPYVPSVNVLKSPHYNPVAFFANNQALIMPSNPNSSTPAMNHAMNSTPSHVPIGCSVVTATGNGFIYRSNSVSQNSLVLSPSVNSSYPVSTYNNASSSKIKNYHSSKDMSQYINSPANVMNKIFTNSSFSNLRRNNYYSDRENNARQSRDNSPRSSPKLTSAGNVNPEGKQVGQLRSDSSENKLEGLGKSESKVSSYQNNVSNINKSNSKQSNNSLLSKEKLLHCESLISDDSVVGLTTPVVITNSKLTNATPSFENNGTKSSIRNDDHKSVIVVSSDEVSD